MKYKIISVKKVMSLSHQNNFKCTETNKCVCEIEKIINKINY